MQVHLGIIFQSKARLHSRTRCRINSLRASEYTTFSEAAGQDTQEEAEGIGNMESCAGPGIGLDIQMFLLGLFHSPGDSDSDFLHVDENR